MKIFQILLSALTTFVIVGFGSFVAVLVGLAGAPMSKNAFWVCVGTGAVAAAKDIRSTMALPPLSNGNYDAIKRFMDTKKDDAP